MPPTRRALASGALALAAVATVTGCTATNPQTTAMGFDPADGADVELGPVAVAQLMVVADDEGLGTLVARIVNSTDEATTVTMTETDGSGIDETFAVDGDSTLAVGPDQDRSVSIPDVGVEPGGTLQVRVAVQGGETETAPVPVLDGTLQEYRTLVPTPTPTATPTPTPTTASPSSRASGSASASTSRTGAAAQATSPGRSSSAAVTQTPDRSGDASPTDLAPYTPGGTPTG